MSALEARFDRLHPRSRYLPSGAAKKLGKNRHQTSTSWEKAKDKLAKTNANEPVFKGKFISERKFR